MFCIIYPKAILGNSLNNPTPTHITGKIIVHQNNEKEKWTFFFISLLIIYQKGFKFHSYKLITPLYNILYRKDACALPAWVYCVDTPPTPIDKAKITCTPPPAIGHLILSSKVKVTLQSYWSKRYNLYKLLTYLSQIEVKWVKWSGKSIILLTKF